MVGAGIFIFPGLAVGKAGPAALLSFIIGGLVALVIALCTAELVTAMPKKGGAYYLISRSMGKAAGSLIGFSQWIGLIFAAAFYLTGFGEYTIELAKEIGIQLDTPVMLIALGSALLLTALNIAGTKGVGKLQNTIVLILTGILSILFFYGLLKKFAWGSPQQGIEDFTPHGWFPVLSTSAMIFTSYLGFIQIATVAGEVKKPQKESSTINY